MYDLFIHVHEKQRCKLTHALAVADFCVIDGVRSQHVEQRLLSTQQQHTEHSLCADL